MSENCENCGQERELSGLKDRNSDRKAFVCQDCIMNEKRHVVERISNHEIGRPA